MSFFSHFDGHVLSTLQEKHHNGDHGTSSDDDNDNSNDDEITTTGSLELALVYNSAR